MIIPDEYTITTPFGWVYGYPLNQTDPINHPGQGFHNGIDYGCPTGTPVVVNGVAIVYLITQERVLGLTFTLESISVAKFKIQEWVTGSALTQL
jgi:murein DD-endopeptidase MepM/ murein hydrolase activator NlpD